MRTLVGGWVLTVLATIFLPVVLASGVVGTVGMVGAVGAGSGGSGSPSGIPAVAIDAYRSGASQCPGLPWEVLAAIGEVESDHGRSRLPGVQEGANAAGAEGPMQFLPSTFGSYGADSGDGDRASPYDLADAASAAARLLCADGVTAPGGLRHAIWEYNHSDSYVDAVLSWAARYEQRGSAGRGSVAAAWALAQVGRPYEWGAAGPDAFDCSGLVLQAWEAASRDLAMLEDVRAFKDLYYHATWARYDLAKPGSLVVIPGQEMLRELAIDYRNMRQMFLSDPPSFDWVVDQLSSFGAAVNG